MLKKSWNAIIKMNNFGVFHLHKLIRRKRRSKRSFEIVFILVRFQNTVIFHFTFVGLHTLELFLKISCKIKKLKKIEIYIMLCTSV